ncbi:MAG: nodulation protein NfeD [Acidilobaceae archaeon]|nr:nodulation protein NfeD [Acidilobaceae archaeon]MCX8165097.1 nodulation protein NfeD [Acidilobaceae archaeon]MDW7974386.1 nodulation protein NfeD [Sulfolobales archaeon]
MRIFLLFLLLLTLSFGANGGDLGKQYCGEVNKTVGIVEGEGFDRKAGPSVLVIKVEGVINEWTKQYVTRAIGEAEKRNVPLIIELNTPGGLADAATDIVVAISRSRVPVIGFVVDKWAESAGTLILMSTHVAAMQPGTIIGSLQPVSYDPATGRYSPVNESKILNPIIKSLCEHGGTKGRNLTAMVRFVLFNDNYGANEALQKGVIDVVATTREELIRKLNGLTIAVFTGERVRLELEGSYEFLDLTLSERTLSILSDPLISGLLLSVGILALVFSIASVNIPGMALGALLIIVGLLGSGLNPNVASLALIGLGAILIFIELNTPGFGIIGGLGIIMIALGIVILPAVPGVEGFTASAEYLNRLLLYLYAIGLAAGVFTAFVSYKILKARSAKPYLWRLEGARGDAIDDISPGKPGFVIVEGEYWKAISDEEIKKGEEVEVVQKVGASLKVRKVRK